MSELIIKKLGSPDGVMDFQAKGHAELFKLGGRVVGHGIYEPGWRWSVDARPVLGTRSCELNHTIFILAGRMHVKMDDGQEGEAGAGELIVVGPGHDAWVVGDEPCQLLDFTGMQSYLTHVRSREQTAVEGP